VNEIGGEGKKEREKCSALNVKINKHRMSYEFGRYVRQRRFKAE
jgi:hypothetical protein